MWGFTYEKKFFREEVDVLEVSLQLAPTKATYPKGQLMASSLRTGQDKVRSTFGKGTEYLFHEPFRNRSPVARDRFLNPPSGTLRGLE